MPPVTEIRGPRPAFPGKNRSFVCEGYMPLESISCRRKIIRLGALMPALALAACVHGRATAEPETGNAEPNPYTVFAEQLENIAEGDVEGLLVRRTGDDKTADFLRTLYKRYGDVSRIYAVTFNTVGNVQRGVFVAAHHGGPFLWDFVKDGDTWAMVRGGMDLEPLLEPATAADDAVAFGRTVIEQLNAGQVDAVFEKIVCNCIGREQLAREVESLRANAGDEETLTYAGAQSVPGMNEQMVRLHFLSERNGDQKLGFHMLLWKADGAWALNGVKWSTEELIPR